VALVVALLVVLVLAAVASTALATSRAALRRAHDDHASLRAELGRSGARAAFAALAAQLPVPELLAGPHMLAPPDTVADVADLGQGWLRWRVLVRGVVIGAELARVAPWVPSCAAVLTGGAGVAAGAVVGDPAVPCDSLVERWSASEVDSLVDSWAARWVVDAEPDTLILTSSAAASVYRARRLIVLMPGVTVHGVVVAPRVEVGSGATVRGHVVARDTVVVASGARLEAASLEAIAGWQSRARLTLLGRRGLLAPP
jgi:hypothetical protein